MAKVEQIVFEFKEIVTAMVKQEGIHEGIWALYIEFGLAAVNAPMREDDGGTPTGKDSPLDHIMPTAILPIKKIGIQRAEQLSNISVDAAVVNPKLKKITGGKVITK